MWYVDLLKAPENEPGSVLSRAALDPPWRRAARARCLIHDGESSVLLGLTEHGAWGLPGGSLEPGE
eukprot:4703584-Prymnesium_polylepis.1